MSEREHLKTKKKKDIHIFLQLITTVTVNETSTDDIM